MKLHELSPVAGSTQVGKRKGRGTGSGNGKTGGRGHKGQKARSGGKVRVGFEGGQMPLARRIPKRGFHNIHAKPLTAVNVAALNCFEDGAVVDAAALIEKTGLILQTSDVTANEKKSGKSDKKSGTTNTQNQVSQASGKSNTNSLGITDDELVEMFNSMTPDEIDEFLNSLFEDNSNDNSNISGYYDSNYAQQVFAMVNQERANNGVDALTWDSSMASYSDRRAMEITTDFSHNSAGGKMNVGENIAEGAISPEMVMDGWMRSDGHRANILNASYTKISVSCYYDGSTYYWVQNFAY